MSSRGNIITPRFILRIIVTLLIADFAYVILDHYGTVWAIIGGALGLVLGWYISNGVTSFIGKSDITRHR